MSLQTTLDKFTTRDTTDWWRKPSLLAVISGVLLTLGFPPSSMGFVAYFGLVPFFYALKQSGGRGGFRLGYIAGLFYASRAIYWIGANSGTYWWAAVASAVMAIAFLALNFALFGWALATIVRKQLPGGLWWAAILWVAVEYLRTFGILVFPWLSLALTQTKYLAISQLASLGGIHGISFWVLLLNTAVYYYLSNRDVVTKRWRYAGIALAIYLVPVLYGSWILRTLPGRDNSIKQIRVGIVQPNIDPNQKWDNKFRREIMTVLDSLTLKTVKFDPDIVLWPETAVPSYLRYNRYGYLSQIRNLIQKIDTPLFTGTPDYEPDTTNDNSQGKYYNAALLVTGVQPIRNVYRKIKLVPFAEYIPYESIFGFFYKFDLGQAHFTPGKEYTIFSLPGENASRFGAMICYDSSFPKLGRMFREKGAEWLAIITNDAWFGDTAGPYQHAELAKLRAIETRIPIARSANTGISMLIDGWGRVQTQLPLNEQGILTGTIVAGLQPTFYATFGNLLSIVLTCLAGGGIIWSFFTHD